MISILLKTVYIDFLNKEKNFTKHRIYFTDFSEARKWALKNLETFSPDMIKYIYN